MRRDRGRDRADGRERQSARRKEDAKRAEEGRGVEKQREVGSKRREESEDENARGAMEDGIGCDDIRVRMEEREKARQKRGRREDEKGPRKRARKK
eukprot:6065738-Pleurochrysis_carterae.AAC.4